MQPSLTKQTEIYGQRRLRKGGKAGQPSYTLRRILVPLDFSGTSRQALTLAVPLAERYGSEIILLHVVQLPVVSAWEAIPGGQHYLGMNLQGLIAAAQERLEAIASKLLLTGVARRIAVEQGIPYEEINDAARRLNADLIVLSTHGHSGLQRALLGSTAERVVRHAHCPVLTVPRQRVGPQSSGKGTAHKLRRRRAWRRILVPTDLSKISLRALDAAVPLARDHGAQIFLLTVIEPPLYPVGLDNAVAEVTDATLFADATSNLPKVAARFVPPSVKVTTLVRRGRAFDVITRLAREQAMDLVVLTTLGRTGLERILIGSTAERVVRHAHCPVYVARNFSRRQKRRYEKG